MITTNTFGDKIFYLPLTKHKRLIFKMAKNHKWFYEGWYDPNLNT